MSRISCAVLWNPSVLNHWLIVVPKSQSADREVPRRVGAALRIGIHYLPKQVFFHRHHSGIWLFSASKGTSAWRMERPYEMQETAFLAMAGMPVLDAVADMGTPPQTMLQALRERGPHWVYERVGGIFSAGLTTCADDGSAAVLAFADFSGYHSVFYIDTDRFFAVGNRASLVAAFRPRFPNHHDISPDVLSWCVGTTMIMGTQTPFAGVLRLRGGYRISVFKDKNGQVASPVQVRMRQDHLASMPNARMDSLALGEVCERMGSRVRWCLDQQVELHAHLTGGRDTRAIAAVLASQGLHGEVRQWLTHGSATNGDVIVAQRIAAALGIEAKHRIRAGRKAERQLGAREFGETLLRSPYVYECQLTPFDGSGTVTKKGRVPKCVTLMGGGGEVYRQEWMSSAALAGTDGGRRALNAFCRHDALGVLSEHAKRWQLNTIGDELEHIKERGVVNLASAFYIEERLSNWGCAHFSNSATPQFPLLLDLQLARFVLSIEDVSEHVHFEMIRHGGHHLLDIPFLNNRWAPATEGRARQLGLAPDPIAVAVKRNFPWQFDCYARFRNALIDFCLDWGEPLRTQVPADHLRKLRRQPVEPFSSAHIKMLFGLCNAVVFAALGSPCIRNFDDGEPPALSGNQAAGVGDSWSNPASQRSPIQDSLFRHLAKAVP